MLLFTELGRYDSSHPHDGPLKYKEKLVTRHYSLRNQNFPLIGGGDRSFLVGPCSMVFRFTAGRMHACDDNSLKRRSFC